MYTLIAENSRGEQLRLTQNTDYTITNIDGLAPPDAVINTMMRAGHDGATFNSAFVETRQIILTLAINQPADVNRNRLYKFFRTARSVRLYYYNDIHGVYIDGYCQNAPVEFFAQKEIAQFTLICPDPFWHGIEIIKGSTSSVESLFTFPFTIDEGSPIPISELRTDVTLSIENPGTHESGIIIDFSAIGVVENPLLYFQNTNAFFGLTTTMQAMDTITIDTRIDHKAITRRRGSTQANLIASRSAGSTWLQAEPGQNDFILQADSGLDNLICKISFVSNIAGV